MHIYIVVFQSLIYLENVFAGCFPLKGRNNIRIVFRNTLRCWARFTFRIAIITIGMTLIVGLRSQSMETSLGNFWNYLHVVILESLRITTLVET
jgi:hypothetical protein